ncbi:MAG: hypothetical protein A3K22_02085 [Deltaproteobacteria bacterium RBG_16_42_7]|nr:MAG: hypothetical protein A3K22_02085 [Deltaproteobacteria bacterium RBG_16_42_7]
MKIIEKDFASILNNDPDGERVFLSIASELNDEDEERFFIITDSEEDTGPREKTKEAAKANAEAMWGGQNSPWDLQFAMM